MAQIPVASRSVLPALSYAQDRYWLLSLLEPNNHAYQLTAALRMRGQLRVEVLGTALTALVQRHEALRTVVGQQDGKPVQQLIDAPELLLRQSDVSGQPDPDEAVQTAVRSLQETPFDLAKDLLVRPLLIRLNRDHHVLVMTVHRLAADESSLGILLRELGTLYSAAIHEGSPNLPELPIAFADFAVWQCSQIHGGGYTRHEDYWRSQFAGDLPVLNLPTDAQRPARTAYAAASRSVIVPEPLVQKLERLCLETNAQQLPILLSAIAIVLGRYSALNEIILGTPAENRRSPEVVPLVGRIGTMLPIRIGWRDTDAVTTLAKSTNDALERAHDHQELPFERILENISLPRDLSRHPLFQVVVELHPDNAPVPSFEGVLTEQVTLERHTVMFDLHITFRRVGGDLRCNCAYATSIFRAERIDRLLEHVCNTLAWMVDNTSTAIGQAEFIGSDERDTLLNKRNATDRELSSIQNVHRCFERQVQLTPTAVAVVCGNEQLVYSQLNAEANRVAHYLQAQGIGIGSRVGICMERSTFMLVALLGAMKAGAVYVPIDPEYPQDRQAFMMQDAQVAMVLTQGKFADRVRASTARVLCVDTELDLLSGYSSENSIESTDAPELLYMIFTSGSTGRPKGSLVYHRGFVNLLTWYCEEFGFDENSRFLVFSSLSFDLTQKNLYAPLISGGTLVLLDTPHYDAARILELMSQHKITLTNCTPSAFYGLLTNTREESLRQLQTLRWVVLGGETISVPRLQPLLDAEWCKATVVNSYGPTECTDVCAFHRLAATKAHATSIPLGRPIYNTQLYVLDPQLRLVPDGAAGELCIGGIGVGAGYVGRPELNAQKFLPNPFSMDSRERIYRTGDLVRYLPNGDIEFLGRIDHQVKIRGFRIELEEISAALDRLPAIRQSYILPSEDVAGDQSLIAYIVPSADASGLSVPQLRSELAKQLPEYMVPTQFVNLDALPLSPNGKVDRSRLPKPTAAAVSPPPQATATTPMREAEQFVAERWKVLLGLSHVGTTERFFDLGGTSLKAIQFIGSMAQELGITLPMVMLFEAPTVGDFVTALRRRFADAMAKRFPSDATENSKTKGARTFAATQGRAPTSSNDIAIIGMAVRLPGAANIAEFWHNLRNGVESIRKLTDEELLAAGVSPEDVADPSYVKAVAAMDDIEAFDANFFKMLPREVELMDPQQRAILECAYSALEHSGYAVARDDLRVGVFAGVARDAYLTGHLLTHPNLMKLANDYSMMIGNEKDFPATRVAYRLDLRGPAVNVQTACSSSGVGLNFACQGLQFDDCDVALVGGCRVLTPVTGYLYADGGTLSPDGHVRAFDARGRGMVRGSGVAFIVVKRLDRALADGDRIYSVIKGIAINNDGAAKVGFTAPSVRGQSAVVQRALEKAGVHPDTISYVETHGTATALGDPIEVTALTDAYRTATDRKGYCAIGSVKTNVGHLDAGACAVGIVKTTLSLVHKEIPPSLNFESPNPQIDFANSPFFVNTQLRKWEASSHARRAGVSSFGLGGTNAHVILEEAPPQTSSRGKPYQVLLLSAKTATALDRATSQLASHFESQGEQGGDEALADAAFTLQLCRTPFEHRRVVVAQNTNDAVTALRKATNTSRAQYNGKRASFLFMFPGQGAQHVNMGKALYDHEPVFRATVDECAELLAAPLGIDLRDILFPKVGFEADATRRLNETSLAQPALFAIGLASARLWMAYNVIPDALVGHSVGEFAAACLAGVFSLNDAVLVLAARARLMQSMPPGSMRAVSLSELALAPYLTDGVSLAGCNGPDLSVVSGSHAAIAAFDKKMELLDTSCVTLHTSHAFHSAMMEPIVPAFRDAVAQARANSPQIPIISTMSGTWLTEQQAIDPGYWAQQLRRPVRFSQAFQTALAKGGYTYIDVGPSANLAAAARRHLTGADLDNVVQSMPRASENVPAMETFANALGRAWMAGVDVEWQRWHEGTQRIKASLPTYPFERKRFWIEPAKRAATDRDAPSRALPTTVTPAQPEPGWAPAHIPMSTALENDGTAAVLAAQLELMQYQLDLLRDE